ncbi:MAG: MBL fold metallo-hydrolase [Alicyclobacillus sp.]|nr:MBL fold metallo-hydrolase [Alicyclobacillus sp.]
MTLLREDAPEPVQLEPNLWSIDLMEQDRPFRTTAYLLLDEYPVLIETGSARSHDRLVSQLRAIGCPPTDLAYVAVTHVHLDHAGGAGQMMAAAPQAKLLVHPRGARHMADPSRLWEGASAVYGARTEALFGAVQPVPEAQILVRQHGDTLHIGSRTLTFLDTPGHAKHHFSVLDPKLDALFAGDALGIRYRTGFTGWDFEWVMPSTSPVDFDPDAVERTVAMLQEVPFQWVYHTHFGRSPKAEALAETERCAGELGAWIRSVYRPGVALDTIVAGLRSWIAADLAKRGYDAPADLEVLDIDVILDAMGLMHYAERLAR